MLRLTLRLTALLTLIGGSLLTLIYAQPYDAPDIRALIESPGCPDPCWQGLQPAVTTGAQAEAVLGEHPWVDARIGSRRLGNGWIEYAWWWSGAQPPSVAADEPGSTLVIDDRVDTVRVLTTLQLGDLWVQLGPPSNGAVFSLGGRPNWQHLAYPEVGVLFQAPLRCQQFWAQPVRLLLNGGAIHATELPDPYDLRAMRALACRWDRWGR
ncbi:MAG: hypothetical protein GYB67_02635 [Chloroflexi bacterium]|nr:hypothetical protein [Chloroflexota bacterium]